MSLPTGNVAAPRAAASSGDRTLADFPFFAPPPPRRCPPRTRSSFRRQNYDRRYHHHGASPRRSAPCFLRKNPCIHATRTLVSRCGRKEERNRGRRNRRAITAECLLWRWGGQPPQPPSLPGGLRAGEDGGEWNLQSRHHPPTSRSAGPDLRHRA